MYERDILNDFLAVGHNTDGTLGNVGVSGEFDTSTDTNLYRVTANNLATGGAFTVGGDIRTYANAQIDGNLSVGNAVAASTSGTAVWKIQIFDANGTSLGYIPVHNSIS